MLQSEKAPFLQAAGARVQYTAFSQVTGVYLSDLAQRNLAEHPEEKSAEISLGLRGQYAWVSELRCTGSSWRFSFAGPGYVGWDASVMY